MSVVFDADLIAGYKLRRHGRPTRQRGLSSTCGRRNCRRCRRWRLITDFSVQKWRDDRPANLRLDCEHCQRIINRTRRYIREQRHRPAESYRVAGILAAMSKEQRVEYELEGCLPIVGAAVGLVFEDLDPSPVPPGCPGSWRGPGGEGFAICTHCPDPDAAKKRRQALARSRPLA
jgi:hypothetical protein